MMEANKGNLGTVLVVDDDPAILVLIQNILTAADYRVLPASGRAAAVHLAEQKHIHLDLALLDIRMPGVRGTEFADEILAVRPNIRILWMSGFVDEEFIRIKVVPGYAGFLPKPLRRAGLLQAVERAIAGAPADRDVQGRGTRTLTAGGG
jgi:DNA-binding NtrC family response regulator